MSKREQSNDHLQSLTPAPDGGPEERELERQSVLNANEDVKGTFILKRNLAGFEAGTEIDERHPLRAQIRQLFLAGDAVRQSEEEGKFGAGSLATL